MNRQAPAVMRPLSSAHRSSAHRSSAHKSSAHKLGAVLRKLRGVVLLGLSLSLGGSTCNNTTPDPATGNIDRISDLVMVRPAPGSDGIARSFVVLANPELEQLRVFDTYAQTFVRAPNIYFPLATKVGPSTRQLAKAPGDETRVYALDGVDHRLRIIRTIDEDSGFAFTEVGTGVLLDAAPADLAVLRQDDGTVLAFVTLPTQAAVAVVVLDPQVGAGDTLARIDLGAGAVPRNIAIDPTGEALIVTDSVLPSVAIVSVADRALDRRIDVGGPSEGVVTGQVDPGDGGMAPVALVFRRDADEVAVLRLRRPANREAHYALLSRVELPAHPLTGYIPDQTFGSALTTATVCCPGVVSPGEASQAWAAISTADGSLYYLRFDADLNGRLAVPRLFDRNADPVTLSETSFNAPEGGEALAPTVQSDAVDNFGDPPVRRLLPDSTLTLQWEGAVPGVTARPATFDAGVLTVSGIASRDVRVGDLVSLDLSNNATATCPTSLETPITAVDGILLSVSLSADDAACAGFGGPFEVSITVANAFVVSSSVSGFLARLQFADAPGPENSLSIPGFLIQVAPSDAGNPLPGSVTSLLIAQNVARVGMELSRQPDSFDQGFGAGAFYPAAIAGGEVFLAGSVDGETVPTRRMYLATQAGRLLEMNETETNINFVIVHQ